VKIGVKNADSRAFFVQKEAKNPKIEKKKIDMIIEL